MYFFLAVMLRICKASMNPQKVRYECMWDNLEMDLNEMEWERMDCIHLA
jgi:hypothetical protein